MRVFSKGAREKMIPDKIVIHHPVMIIAIIICWVLIIAGWRWLWRMDGRPKIWGRKPK